jgi:hypothetical protein
MPTNDANVLVVTGCYHGMILHAGPHAWGGARSTSLGFATTVAVDPSSAGQPCRIVTPVNTPLNDPPTLSLHATFHEQTQFKVFGVEFEATPHHHIEGSVEIEAPESPFRIDKMKLTPGLRANFLNTGLAGRRHTLRFNIWFDPEATDPASAIAFRMVGGEAMNKTKPVDQIVLRLTP